MGRLKGIKLITFDVTNTLLKINGTIGELYAEAAQVYGVDADSDKVESNFRNGFLEYNKLVPNFGRVVGMPSTEWWKLVVKATFSGYEINPVVFDKVCEDLYRNFKKGEYWKVFPDAAPALTQLQKEGVKLGVISNFDERLPTILDNLNLTKYFSFVVTSRNTTFYKPLPEIFHHALSLAPGLSPMEALHIGDDLNLDYKAAKKAGLGSLVLLRKPIVTQLNHLLENNVELKDIIHNLTELFDKLDAK